MALVIEDDATAELVGELARRRQVSQVEAVRLAVASELERTPPRETVLQTLERFWAEHPLPPRTGMVADKAFFDALSGET